MTKILLERNSFELSGDTNAIMDEKNQLDGMIMHGIEYDNVFANDLDQFIAKGRFFSFEKYVQRI